MPIKQTSDSVILEHGNSTATVAFKGATVYSFTQESPSGEVVERLFTSSKSNVAGSDPAAIRGGIPICWPVFGPPPTDNALYAKLKQHGFARTSTWSFDESESIADADGKGERAVFKLASTAEIQKVFDLPFELAYHVHVRESKLIVTLHVTSPSSATVPLPFQALLHSYLRLPSSVLPPQVQVTPLEGLKFADKVQGGKQSTEDRSVVDVEGPKGEVDRVYFGAPDTLKINYKGTKGGVEVVKAGLSDVVLWNPGQEKGATIGDMEQGGAERYVCLEPGQVGSFVELAPGASWEGSVAYSFADAAAVL